MKTKMKKDKKVRAFTIIELLTVMSIIVILMSLLVPALNNVRRHAKDVRQSAQFHAIGVALDLFQNEFGDYPGSDANDVNDDAYCGAMKLAEAMLGQDLLGFHPQSIFDRDGFANGEQLYPLSPAYGGGLTAAEYKANLQTRKGPYLQVDKDNAHRMKNIYGAGSNVSPFLEGSFVMCDVYTRVTLVGDPCVYSMVGRKVGMPILYYKADTTNVLHNDAFPDDSIYDYRDNDELVAIGKPWDFTDAHELDDPANFYFDTWNTKITAAERPYNPDSYILISAGYDGEYGTVDDVYNFGN